MTNEPWQVCNEFQWGLVDLITQMERDKVLRPTEFGTLHKATTLDVQSAIYRCMLHNLLRPVFRVGEGRWTTELLEFVGIDPTEITVGFRRTGNSL